MPFDKIILYIMAVGVLLGALDRIIGNKFGLGEQFEEGFNSMGPLALGMVGIVCLAPVISDVLGPIIIPIFNLCGADPSMFATILANDMGGYPLAMELAHNKEAGMLAGLVVSSMLGCTLVFSIPVGLGLIEYEDRPFFAKGLLIGLITIPFGGIIGGLIAGFNSSMVIINMIPVIILAVILAVGLKFNSTLMINGSLVFGKFISILITIGLGAAAFQEITGIVLIKGMTPIREGIQVIGSIAIVLLGTFPILHLLVKVLNKPLTIVGGKLGMDATSAAGLVFTLANSIPVYKMMKDMSPKGKVVNTAWLVCATAALGDHLGFTAGVVPEMITPVVIGKLVGGVLAIALAILMTKDLTLEEEQSIKMKKDAV
ncbi:ethanolamine utilization protein EutH [Clostridioides difficile]|uniref:ethanolamine utilization protein EutH n=1 Tax=Clostridioides difficile TaxID=1496 RepID=UPI001C183BD6|nr:ethanolamine utilization protein EutH [Clostridioides difficile]MCL6919686.1 ethanolamine utilization protein EutH [Clostridioides difficile]MCU5934556.1 ethanolamine utilization protein EutH [Clostridioides difficile]HBF8443076.1 ethanolamine utilization protein EutH [Clostridioides difficile]HBF8596962.1 ethanolamine utilization protein EutH [Clostridioides difficile]HBY2674273.1 ethanolamine utilization protein EutH [Clostridioides difficile]